CRPFVLPGTDESSVQPDGTVSVTVQVVPTGIPLIVVVPLAVFDAVMDGVNVPAAPQFTVNGKVPLTGIAYVPDTALVMTRSDVWRVLVKLALAVGPAWIVIAPAGPEVWVQPTCAVSVTVHPIPVGMPFSSVDCPAPAVVVTVRVVSHAVP